MTTEPEPTVDRSKDYALDVLTALQDYLSNGKVELALKYLEVVMEACEYHGHFIGTWQERVRQLEGGEPVELPEWLRE